jgi:hypothetical protein
MKVSAEMGYFRDALNIWDTSTQLNRDWQLDELIEARKHVISLLAVDTPLAPPVVDIEAVYRKLRGIADDEQDIQTLNRRELRIGVWTLFRQFKDGLPPLCTDAYFFRGYLQAIGKLSSARPVSGLILNFLEDYPRQSHRFDDICVELASLLRDYKGRLRDFSSRIEKFQLLRSVGPGETAHQVVFGPESVEETLEHAYLVGSRARHGFVSHVHKEACSLMKSRLQKGSLYGQRLWRALEFCAFEETGRELRIVSQRVELAEALLQPFQETSPDESVKEDIKKFLLEFYGDPRTQRAKWQGVAEDYRAVMIRWLVQDTFEDFFRIVDLTQKSDKDADRQWPYRKAFWLAYFRKDVVTDAWLVLGYEIATNARQQLAIESENYGRMSGMGIKPSHAVLILKIQDYIIVEWSHVGKYRMWHESDQYAPKLYAKSYDRTVLTRQPAVEGVHYSASAGGWQSKLASKIRGRTGISINRLEYMRNV